MSWVWNAWGSGGSRVCGLVAQTMMANGLDFCETGINSVILVGIYEYIFQGIELVCGFLARI